MGDHKLLKNTPVGVMEMNTQRGGRAETVYLVERMAALGNYVRFLAWESETEAERFEADRAFCLFFRDVS